MPCLEGPLIPKPQLSEPLSFTSPGITVAPNLGLCCRLPIKPLTLGAVTIPIDPATLQIINAGIDQAHEAIDTYLDAFPLECPREAT